MILFNIISIFTYLFATVAMFKPAYVGVTIGLLILVFETSWIMVWKYRANNYQMSASVVVAMLVSVLTMLFWVIYIVLEVVTDENENDFVRAGSVFVAVIYLVSLIGALLYLEYESSEH